MFEENTIKLTEKELAKQVFYSPFAVYTCDLDGYISFFNKGAVQLWGREPIIGKDFWYSFWKFYYPDGSLMPLEESPMALTLKDGRTFDGIEIVIEKSDHTFLNLLIYPHPIVNKQNIRIGAHNTLINITRQKTAEAKQLLLSSIVASSDDAIVSKTLDGLITSWNQGAEKIFGYTEQEVLGKHLRILIPVSIQQEEETIMGSIRQGIPVDHYQTLRLHKSGREINVSISISPIKNSQGQVIGASKVARDLTNQLKFEDALKLNARNLQLLNVAGRLISGTRDLQLVTQKIADTAVRVTGAESGFFVYSESGSLSLETMAVSLSGAHSGSGGTVKREYKKLLSWPGLLDRKVLRLSNPENIDQVFSSEAAVNPSPVGSFMTVPVVSTSASLIGKLILLHGTPSMFQTEHEDMAVIIASQASVALDNMKLFEEVKALSAKKDEFIALASHELKTPLTSIKGYLQILESTEQESSAILFIKKTLHQVNKLNTLVIALFDLSRIETGKLPLQKESFDLTQLIYEIVDSFLCSNNIHQLLFCEDQPIFILADKQRIEQVIVNLLTNAIKYSPQRGQITIRLNHSSSDITVIVRDQGIGMSFKEQLKVFSRFYRSEIPLKTSGLGLGLYISKEIIERHNGKIWVISVPGKGSEFSFSLPLNTE